MIKKTSCVSGKSSLSSDTSIKKDSKNSTFVQIYLIGYNSLQAIGWSIIFYKLVTYYFIASTISLYDTVECALMIFQNAAVLEVIHASIGIVKSNPTITAFQVASRVIVVCGILLLTQAARDTIGLPTALTAWSITEIIRYSNYALSMVNMVPNFLKWLRYTTFIVLYPIGVTGELLCIYAAQKEIGDGYLYSLDMPNRLNFIFNYQQLLWFIMLLYIPFFPQLYFHMFSQRRKILGSPVNKVD